MTIFEQLRAGVATSSGEEMRDLAAALAQALSADTVLALHGDLGVGKTTFVQGLACGLGIVDPITSPTFTLYNLHRGPKWQLAHLDAYRLGSAAQLDALMLEDFLVSPYCLAVEWPQHVAAWLPPGTLHLDLSIAANGTHPIRLRS